MTAPPPRLTAEQKATAAALRTAGCPDGLAVDAACGRLDVEDVRRWCGEWQAARAADRYRGGVGADREPGGAVLGTKEPPGEDVLWIGRTPKGKRVQGWGPCPTDPTDKHTAELWTLPGAAGWWRVPRA